MSLRGKVALVTGSTSGIGLGIARALAQQGSSVVLNGFGDPAQIETLRGSIATEFAVRVDYSAADISQPDQIAKMIKTTEETFGKLDILVNNAGIQFIANIEEFPTERWDAIIAINLSGVFHGMKAAIPGMKTRGWGRIINIASAHGLVASAQKAAYVAAKHGVLGITKVAAIETANHGITVNAICPGWVLTPLVQRQLEDRARAERTDLETPEAPLPCREAGPGRILDARADRCADRVSLLRERQDNHRRTALDRWRLGRAIVRRDSD
jgi:3-hydroxybutyrate dehydrogenase